MFDKSIIVIRTPLFINLLDSIFDNISFTIDKYVYNILKSDFDNTYTLTELFNLRENKAASIIGQLHAYSAYKEYIHNQWTLAADIKEETGLSSSYQHCFGNCNHFNFDENNITRLNKNYIESICSLVNIGYENNNEDYDPSALKYIENKDTLSIASLIGKQDKLIEDKSILASKVTNGFLLLISKDKERTSQIIKEHEQIEVPFIIDISGTKRVL